MPAMGVLGAAVLAAVVPRFPLPANVIYPSLCVVVAVLSAWVVAVLTWFAAHWMAGPRGAGVPNIRTPADKMPDNGGGDSGSPRAEQT